MVLNDRAGFTIVEVIVAIIILTVGLLGIVGATAKLAHMRAQGDRMAAAAFYATDRMERLRANGCGLAASGTNTEAGFYVMTWTVGAQVGGTMPVMVEASYPTGTATSAVDTFETWIPC